MMMVTNFHTVSFCEPLVDARLNALPGVSADLHRLMSEREENSFVKGRQAAENSFSQQMVSQRNEMLALQNGVLNAVRSAIPELIRDAEHMLVELAVATAERLVANMPIDQSTVEATIREALAQVEDGSSVRVLLHLDDLALLKEGGSELLNAESDTGALSVEASADISRGGCVLQTRFGDIDARRETKLEQVKQALQS